MELNKINILMLSVFENLKDELNVVIEEEITESTNIFEILDSMDVVNLIMETESLLEQELGFYIPLANEETFDAEKSPLQSYKKWLHFIFDLIKGSHES
jgi:acyl carrier protein